MESQRKNVLPFVIGAFLVVLAGVVTAWVLSSKVMNKNETSGKGAPGVKVTSTEAGKLDPNIKYDTAEGMLKEGGANGEGTYHLEREGGVSKNVYLTSSMVDLNLFTGKKVQIWGETLASKKAGWLMDVAKIQVTE
ncbi:MAG: hypothetical protein ACD_13C00249G0004 [uncultured bacterium]|nr:MAG: hypothetical protein ACD_13C00249G0004 [uncultured bacterium]KKR54012.1 MAG: hypothetical protein UT88_C0004G0023 [Candidatus Woesebacteria bacterium GW2011_GWD2_40_19]KKR56570.1 MAG: hypothetical protein UT96_C0040G0004 [Candidatus Woesebacteria bacterium GW2011_GWC2_40_30]HAU65248.1 hypothetical protein [Candidatus Woesebacteria bacterium]HCC09059.1 hypothetical protein [Candidatus Woesebacteria bacterium]